MYVICFHHELRAPENHFLISFFSNLLLSEKQTESLSTLHNLFCVLVNRLTHRAEGAHSVAALLPCQVFLIAHGAHAIGSRVAIETTACGTKHGHRALVRLLGHC